MACIYSTFEIICHKLPSPGRRARARSLAAALMLSACLALGAAKTAVPVAVAQELQWATSVGGDGSVSGAGIATGPSGESYVTGSFDGTVTFGAGEPNETVLEAVPTVLFPFRNDMFLATYASDGTLAWATSAGGISQVFGRAVATDPQGNSYVTGTIDCGNVFVIMCTATFGAGEANETVLEPMGEGGSSIFVAKYARDGALLWAKIAGGGSVRADGRGIATEPRGNSYVTGSFVGMVTFGAGEAKETVLEPYVRAGLFVAKYAPDGTFLWVKSAGATELREDGEVSVFGLAIARDARGNSYVAGSLECDFISRQEGGTCPATFGAGEPKETVLEARLAVEMLFLAKYGRDGTLAWATSPSGSIGTFASVAAVATDPRGNSYLTGRLDCLGNSEVVCSVTFGAGGPNETIVEILTDEHPDIFLARYAPDGTLAWAKSVGGADHQQGTGVATDAGGNSYVTGRISGTVTFGAGAANETVLGTPGGTDAFVAKYARDGTLLWATTSAGGHGIATDRRGNSYVIFGSFSGTATFGAGQPNETVLEGGGMFVAKYRDRTDRDQCPNSDRSATVVIDGIDTGVENGLTGTGCTIIDLILQASDDAADRAEFIREVALLTRTLLRDGLITAEEAGILRTAASHATFPLS